MRARMTCGLLASTMLAGLGASPVLAQSSIAYTYDVLGRVQTATYPNGSVVTYTYDPADNRTHLTMTLPANHAPSASADGPFAVAAGTAMTIAVRDNDSDPDNDPLIVTAVGQPTNGTGVTTVTAGGAGVVYTANAGASGTDTFNYTLSDGRGGTSQAAVSISLPAPPPPPVASIAPASLSQQEGSSGTTAFTFTVTRSGSTTGSSTVVWSAASEGSNPAVAGDFSGAISGTLSFAAGETSKTITLNVLGDTTIEPDEQFRVTLQAQSGITISPTQGSAVGTIVNDDVPQQTVSIAAFGSVSKLEGNSGSTPFTFTVTRSSGSGTAMVSYAVGDHTPPTIVSSDMAGAGSGTVSFAAGETSKQITVYAAGDTAVEPNESFKVQLHSPSAGLAITSPTEAYGTILDDDTPGVVSITANNPNQSEGSTYTFTISRSGNTSGSGCVAWAVGEDFPDPIVSSDMSAPGSGSVCFNPGETSKQISQGTVQDTAVEPNERFKINLHSPSGVTIGSPASAGAVINNDDAPPPPPATVYVWGSAGQYEGNSGGVPYSYGITRSHGQGSGCVNWYVGERFPNPIISSDMTGAGSGTVCFGPGETTKYITVYAAGDTIPEQHEQFQINLFGASNLTIVASDAFGVIWNDDP